MVSHLERRNMSGLVAFIRFSPLLDSRSAAWKGKVSDMNDIVARFKLGQKRWPRPSRDFGHNVN